jgi:DNA-binding protein HU-beta
MNRAELVEQMAARADVTKADAERVLGAMLEAVATSLQNGDPVVIVNFGTFTVKGRKERKGRNPQTGEEIKIPPSKVVGFKAGKALKEAVKEDLKQA